MALDSYRPQFGSTISRGTKLEISEINYLKSIAGTEQIIYNRSFLSFSLNKEKSIKFEANRKIYDEIGQLYNKTFYNRGGVVDKFSKVINFIEEIYSNLDSFITNDKYKGIFTKNYKDLIVFEKVGIRLQLIKK